MSYELITVSNSNKIRKILKDTVLNKNIEISIDNLELDLKIDSVSITMEEEHFMDMDKIYFMFEDSTSVLKLKDREYELFST